MGKKTKTTLLALAAVVPASVPATAQVPAPVDAILARFDDGRCQRGDLRTRADLNILADSLTATAIANPGTEVAFRIRIALRIAGDHHPSEGCTRYDGAWNALVQIYESGSGVLRDLVDIDVQRGIEYGLTRLADLEGTELCSFIGMVVQFGEISLLADGTLEFEAHPGANYALDTPPLQPDWTNRKVVLAEDLLVKGFIGETGWPWSPCGTDFAIVTPLDVFEVIEHPDGTISLVVPAGAEPVRPDTTLEGVKGRRGFYLVNGDTVRVLKRR